MARRGKAQPLCGYANNAKSEIRKWKVHAHGPSQYIQRRFYRKERWTWRLICMIGWIAAMKMNSEKIKCKQIMDIHLIHLGIWLQEASEN